MPRPRFLFVFLLLTAVPLGAGAVTTAPGAHPGSAVLVASLLPTLYPPPTAPAQPAHAEPGCVPVHPLGPRLYRAATQSRVTFSWTLPEEGGTVTFARSGGSPGGYTLNGQEVRDTAGLRALSTDWVRFADVLLDSITLFGRAQVTPPGPEDPRVAAVPLPTALAMLAGALALLLAVRGGWRQRLAPRPAGEAAPGGTWQRTPGL